MINFLIDYYAPLSKLPATYWWMLGGCGVLLVAVIGYAVWDWYDYRKKIREYFKDELSSTNIIQALKKGQGR